MLLPSSVQLRLGVWVPELLSEQTAEHHTKAVYIVLGFRYLMLSSAISCSHADMHFLDSVQCLDAASKAVRSRNI